LFATLASENILNVPLTSLSTVPKLLKLPKGSSFDNLTQQDLNLIFSHINSVSRKSLGGKTPYQIFCSFHDAGLPSTLDIIPIHPDDVIQNTKLLKNNNGKL
jgi:hypothetical protein